jgi:hypothetical protein
MSNAVAELEPEAAAEQQDGLALIRKQDAIVKELKKHLSLTIAGVNDKKGLAAVHDARIEARDARIAVEKTRKKLNEDAQAWQKKVNAEAKRVTDDIVLIETSLRDKEDAIETEKARIKAAADEARRIKVKQRYDALQACGYTGDMMAVPEMADEAFAKVLATAQAEKVLRDRAAEEERQRQAAEAEAAAEATRKASAALDAERERLAAIQKQQEADAAAKRKAEEAELKAERERLTAVKRQQDAEAERLRAEQARIEEDRQAHARAAEIERARAEASERSRVETEQRLAREAEAARLADERKAAQERADAEAKEAERLKAEALKPQREKLLAVASALDAIEVPDGPGSREVYKAIERCMNEIQEIANGPLE